MNSNLNIILTIVIVILLISLLAVYGMYKKSVKAELALHYKYSKLVRVNTTFKMLLKTICQDLLDSEGRVEEGTYPFRVYDSKTNKLIETTAIRFKKREKDIPIYLNGAMVPSTDRVFINNITSLHKQEHTALIDAYNLVGSVYVGNATKELIIKDLRKLLIEN